MLAQCQYRMKIRKAENIAESSVIFALRKFCKNLHQFANCDSIRTYYNRYGKIIAEASIALQRQSRLAPQNHHTLRNSEGAITFRPHHKPGHCAISKWLGPVNALTAPLCQETWSVPESQRQSIVDSRSVRHIAQHQGRHRLSCELKSKTRGKDT